MSSETTSSNSCTARRGYVTYQALKDKHGKKIADRMRDEKRKQQETMDKEGSTDRPVVKPSEDLPDCEEPWGLSYNIYISPKPPKKSIFDWFEGYI